MSPRDICPRETFYVNGANIFICFVLGTTSLWAGCPSSSPSADVGDVAVQWVPLQSTGPHCNVERAANPSAFMSIAWEPCGASLPGCLELNDNRPQLELFAIDPHGAASGSGYHVFAVTGRDLAAQFPRRGSQWVYALADVDGRVYGAWRITEDHTLDDLDRGISHCSFVGPTTREGMVSFGVTEQREDRSSSVFLNRYYHAPLHAIGALDRPVSLASPEENGLITSLLTSGMSAMVGVAGSRLHVFSPSRDIVRGELPSQFSLLTDAYRDHALWMARTPDHAENFMLAISNVDGGHDVLRWETGRSLFMPVTDGTWLVWIRRTTTRPDPSSPGDGAGELFVSPWTSVGEELRPRRVRSDVPVGHLEIGDGLVAYSRSLETAPRPTSSLEVVDLVTGQVRSVTLHEAGRFRDPLSVTREEVLVPVQRDTGTDLVRWSVSAMPLL